MDPNLSTSIHLSANQVEIAFSLLLARYPILLSWKKAKPTSHKHWVVEVMSYLKLESMLFQGSSRKFYKVWQPFLSFVESLWDTIS